MGKVFVKRKRYFTLAVLITLLGTERSQSGPKTGEAEISFVIGKVILKREGRVINPQKGDPVFNGDIFRLSKQSLMKLSISGGKRILSVRGPKVFRFTLKALDTGIKRGSAATAFTRLMAKNSPPYVPRTIVSAVRSRDDSGKRRELNRRGKLQLKRAIDLIKEEKYFQSWEILNDIEKFNSLNRHVKALLNFYRGEIRFHEMKFREALPYYRAAVKYKHRKFRHLEESYVRAALSADLAGKTGVLADIISEYEKYYGKKGQYRDILKEYK